MKKILMILSLLSCLLNISVAQTGLTSTAEPISCISGVFNPVSSGGWYTISIKFTNLCGKSIDMQNSGITFNNKTLLNTNFWGNFEKLSYPDNVLNIASQPNPAGGYIASLSLHFPIQPWSNSILGDKESFTINYGSNNADYDPGSLKVYVTSIQAQGSIQLKNTSTQPTVVQQPYALIDLIANGQKYNTIQVPWNSSITVSSVPIGIYTVSPQSVSGTDMSIYEGTAYPATLTVLQNQTTSSNVSYQKVIQYGSVMVQTNPLPTELTGYTGLPTIQLTRSDTGATIMQNVPWSTTTTINSLENNRTYQLSTPIILFNNFSCAGTFTPAILTSSATNPPLSKLSYTCTSTTQDTINIQVKGLPCEATKITVTFQPNNGSAPINKDVNISGGGGSTSLSLTDGVIYTVSSSSVTGYDATFSPQPVMAKPNVTEAITYFPIPKRK